MTNWVNVSNAANVSATSSTNKAGSKSSLGKDEFLKILTVQLSNQDPSNPLSDTDFIAQMATFSSLEQMMNLNQMFEKFTDLQMGQYASTIGKEITWTPTDATVPMKGIVTGVSKEDNKFLYLVGNEKVPMDQVTQIKNAQTDSI